MDNVDFVFIILGLGVFTNTKPFTSNKPIIPVKSPERTKRTVSSFIVRIVHQFA